MAGLQLHLQTTSPLFMAGANPKQPEIRAASFRGLLRYWLRAVLGASYQQDYVGLKQHESHYWGSTDRGSALRLVVDRRPPHNTIDKYGILPPTFKYGKPNELAAYPVEAMFQLRLDTLYPHRAASLFTDELYASLMLAFWLGGSGKRARRGGGALHVDAVDGDMMPADVQAALTYIPQDGADAARHLDESIFPYVRSAIANAAIPLTQPFGTYPDYTVMLPDFVYTFVGKTPYTGDKAYLNALEQMWQMTGIYHHNYRTDASGNIIMRRDRKGREKPIEDESAWGYALHNKRRASVVHMRVVRSYAGWHPMVTFLLAGEPGEDWPRIQRVIKVFQAANDFIPVTY